MTFRSHDGLTECTNFADFYHWTNQHKLRPCPNCSYQMEIKMYPTFNMHKHGKALLFCPNDQCQFNEKPIKIEATGGG